VKVPHNKEVAIHVAPESCVSHREVWGEALTGARIGQPSSHDRNLIPGADAVTHAEGNTAGRTIASAPTTRNWLRVSCASEFVCKARQCWVSRSSAESAKIRPFGRTKWREPSNGNGYRRV